MLSLLKRSEKESKDLKDLKAREKKTVPSDVLEKFMISSCWQKPVRGGADTGKRRGPTFCLESKTELLCI